MLAPLQSLRPKCKTSSQITYEIIAQKWIGADEKRDRQRLIIGNPSIFAIESHIAQAFERSSERAIGSFTILIMGHRYGVFAPDATMLALSFDEVEKRIGRRGTHITPFTDGEARGIADAFRSAVYGPEYGQPYPGIAPNEFAGIIHSSHIIWAPDGDEAFDDGSYILQFDSDDRVRLIGFTVGEKGRYDPSTLRDLWLDSEQFYSVLHHWHSAFLAELQASSKTCP